MTSKESKAVAFADRDSLEELAADRCRGIQVGTYSERYHRTVPLYEESALHAAEAELAEADSQVQFLTAVREANEAFVDKLEAELGELRRRVGELAEDMRDSVKSVCETGGYINSDDVLAWEAALRTLLASDGGADGGA